MRRRKVLIVITLLTLCLIWVHSAVGREDSAAESGWLFEHIGGLLRLIFGPERATEHLLRKLAHFSEFFLLGAEMYLLAAEYKRTGAAASAGVLLRCNFCALIDETIQIFSGRGPEIKDVWLDTFGAASGILITLLILSVRNRLAGKESGKERADK